MTPQELTLWAFALLLLAVATACTIVVGYVTFKVMCAIKEKGLQDIEKDIVTCYGELINGKDGKSL